MMWCFWTITMMSMRDRLGSKSREQSYVPHGMAARPLSTKESLGNHWQLI
jgi:hypothetical protein